MDPVSLSRPAAPQLCPAARGLKNKAKYRHKRAGDERMLAASPSMRFLRPSLPRRSPPPRISSRPARRSRRPRVRRAGHSGTPRPRGAGASPAQRARMRPAGARRSASRGSRDIAPPRHSPPRPTVPSAPVAARCALGDFPARATTQGPADPHRRPAPMKQRPSRVRSSPPPADLLFPASRCPLSPRQQQRPRAGQQASSAELGGASEKAVERQRGEDEADADTHGSPRWHSTLRSPSRGLPTALRWPCLRPPLAAASEERAARWQPSAPDRLPGTAE